MYSLCVCSLLTGKVDLLPPLDAGCFDGEGVRGYAILPSSNHGAPPPQRSDDGYSNLFQVLLIGVHHGGKQLLVRSFSTSATSLQNWGTESSSMGDAGSLSGPYGSRVATVWYDKAHWLFQMDSPTGPTIFAVEVCIITGHLCSNRTIFNVPRDCCNTRLSLVFVNAVLVALYLKRDRVTVRTVWGLDELLPAAIYVARKSHALLFFCSSDPKCPCLFDWHSRSTTKVAGWKGL